jgi:hypothetical protein
MKPGTPPQGQAPLTVIFPSYKTPFPDGRLKAPPVFMTIKGADLRIWFNENEKKAFFFDPAGRVLFPLMAGSDTIFP